MKRETAIALLEAVERVGAVLNEIDGLARQIERAEERKVYVRMVGQVMALTGYDLVMHIVRQYPDLDPDK